MTIKVIDSVMGSGKTSFMINMIKGNPDKKYCYITPYLAEVQRVKDNCPNFVEPEINKRTGETKLYDFNKMLESGVNVVSTHALFKNTNGYTLDALKKHNYTLIMDEVLEVVSTDGFKKDDLPTILAAKLAHIDESTGYLVWDKDDYDGAYNKIKNLCKSKCVTVIDNQVLIWTFPANIFSYFSEVYVCTYMFDVQILKHYFDLHKLSYKKHSVEKNNDSGLYELCEYNPNEDRSYFKINIYTGKKNNCGTYKVTGKVSYEDKKVDYNLLSGTRFEKLSKDQLNEIKRNMVTWFKHDLNNSPSENNLWTCILGKNDKNRKALAAPPYTKGFAPCNCRATNEYRHKTAVAYIPNRFMDVNVKKFFSLHGISIGWEQDKLWGLSEMLQFIWRSAIRTGKEIDLYVPSVRMRHALQDWLGKPRLD